MNNKLLTALRHGWSENTRQEVLKIVQETQAEENELVVELEDVELTKVVNLAAMFLSKATRRVYDGQPDFTTALNMQMLVDGLGSLMRNPAILNYTQAVIILTIALLTERIEREAI